MESRNNKKFLSLKDEDGDATKYSENFVHFKCDIKAKRLSGNILMNF